MNIFFNGILKILPFITLFTLAVYLTGSFVMHFLKSTYKSIFFFADKITLGIFVLIIVFSIIYSRGNTFLSIPIIALLCYGLSKNVFASKPIKLRPLQIKQILAFVVVFSVVSFGMMSLSHFDNRLLTHYDMSSYARLAYNMRATGQEKLILDPIYIGDYPKQLFHFFNEWITVFISFFLNKVTVLEIMLYVTFPLLTTTIFFQLLSITTILLGKIKVIDMILVAVIVLLLPNIIKVLYHYIPNQPVPSTSIFHCGLYFIKLKVILLLSLVSFKLYLQNKLFLALIIFSAIPIFWNTLVPVFIIGLVFLLIYQILNKEKINKIFYGIQFISLALLFVYMHVNPNADNNLFAYSILDYVKAEFRYFDYVKKVVIFILISALPLLLFYIKKFRLFLKDTYKRYLFFLLLASCLNYSLIFELYNAKQLIINLIFPILFPISVYLVSLSYKVLKKRFRYVAIIVLIFVFCHGVFYSKQLETDFDVPAVFSSRKKVFIASDLRSSNMDPFYYYIRPYGFLMLKNEHWLPQRIDLLDHTEYHKPIDKYHYYQNVMNQSFFKFASSQDQRLDSINTDDLKLKFLRDYKFEYLLVNQDEINSSSSSYLQNLNIVNSDIFDNNIILLKLKWH